MGSYSTRCVIGLLIRVIWAARGHNDEDSGADTETSGVFPEEAPATECCPLGAKDEGLMQHALLDLLRARLRMRSGTPIACGGGIILITGDNALPPKPDVPVHLSVLWRCAILEIEIVLGAADDGPHPDRERGAGEGS